MRAPLTRIRGANRSLADQLMRAASSGCTSNRIVAGSAAEVRSALDAVEALGFVEAAEIAESWDRFDQVVRILRAITR